MFDLRRLAVLLLATLGPAPAMAQTPSTLRLGKQAAESACVEQAELKRFALTRPRLGTLITVIIYAKDRARANKALSGAFERIDQLDAILSDYDLDSELSRLCQSAPHAEPVAASRELGEVLTLSRSMHKRSGGAFDVTVGPVTRLWRRARRKRELPSQEMLDEALRLVGDGLLELHSGASGSPVKVRLKRAGMRLDLGGVAKGYIVDQALAALKKAGVTSALVNAGGDIGVSAAPPGTAGWKVGVASENTRGKPDRVIELKHAAVATSGDAFQAVTIDGVRYSHIVDPKTGLGLTRRSAVTVVAPTCAAADAWASALCVLGPKDGLRAFPNAPDYHARILTAGDGAKLSLSESKSFPAGEAVDVRPPSK